MKANKASSILRGIIKGVPMGIAMVFVWAFRLWTTGHVQTIILISVHSLWIGYSILGVMLCAAILCWDTAEGWGWSLISGIPLLLIGIHTIPRSSVLFQMLTGNHGTNAGTGFLLHTMICISIIDLGVLGVIMILLAWAERKRNHPSF